MEVEPTIKLVTKDGKEIEITKKILASQKENF